MTLRHLAMSYIASAFAFILLAVFEGENPLALFWDTYNFAPIYPLSVLLLAMLTLILPTDD